MRTVSLKLTDALLQKVELAARERGYSKSDLIRLALEQYLNGERRAGRGSFLEVAGDLIGCAEGPNDLSFNPEHMEGFGR